jgi:hypothetical protein
LRVGYKTPILSETDNNLFAVFKTIVDELCPEGDGVNENYPETGKRIFFKNEMHDVLHYDGGYTVKIAPSLRHDAPFLYPKLCAVILYHSSNKTYVVPKVVIPLQASVPCLSVAVATSN